MTRKIQHIYYHFLNIWRDQRPILVGLGFTLFMAGTGFHTIIYRSSGEDTIRHHIPVALPSAQNIKVGAPVYVLGVPSGYVESFQLVTLDASGKPYPLSQDLRDLKSEDISGQFILASVALNRVVKLSSDASIFAKYQNILSEKTLEVDPGRKGDGDRYFRFTDGERETLRTTGHFPDRFYPGDLIGARNFDDPLFLIASVLAENRKGLRRITSNLREATEKMSRGRGDIAMVLNEDELYDGVLDLEDELVYLVNDARDGLESYRETDPLVRFLGGPVVNAIFYAIK